MSMKARPFAELYCEENHLPPEAYSRHIFRRALYPHARLVAWLIDFVNGDYFTPDRDFIEDAGQLTQYHAFVGSGMDFSHHPSNRGFMRRVLLVRVSTDRMRRIVKGILKPKSHSHHDNDEGTMKPFVAPDKTPDGKGSQSGAPLG